MVLAEVARPPSILVAGSPVEAAELIVLLFQQFRIQHSGTPFNAVRVGKYRSTSLTWRIFFFSSVFTSKSHSDFNLGRANRRDSLPRRGGLHHTWYRKPW